MENKKVYEQDTLKLKMHYSNFKKYFEFFPRTDENYLAETKEIEIVVNLDTWRRKKYFLGYAERFLPRGERYESKDEILEILKGIVKESGKKVADLSAKEKNDMLEEAKTKQMRQEYADWRKRIEEIGEENLFMQYLEKRGAEIIG